MQIDTSAHSSLPQGLRQEIIARGHGRLLRKGHMIIESGTEDRGVYLVVEGRVEVSLLSARGQNMVIRDIGAGALFGEFAALNGRARSASVVAAEDSRIVEISGETFLELLDKIPGAGLWIARQIADEVRRLTQRHFEMATMAVTARIQCELLHLASKSGIRDDCACLNPAPTHAEIAARVGSHREAVTREFGYLARTGIITQEKRSITIYSVSRLVEQIQRTTGEDLSAELLLHT